VNWFDQPGCRGFDTTHGRQIETAARGRVSAAGAPSRAARENVREYTIGWHQLLGGEGSGEGRGARNEVCLSGQAEQVANVPRYAGQLVDYIRVIVEAGELGQLAVSRTGLRVRLHLYGQYGAVACERSHGTSQCVDLHALQVQVRKAEALANPQAIKQGVNRP